MNKKTIIQLVIIVVAFGAAGVVLYNGFFSGGSPAVNQTGATASTTTQDILPYGENLDFSQALNPKRFQYNQLVYPVLDPKNDVGISEQNLITPTPTGP